MKFVYFFGAGKAEGNGEMKEVLGGKGAGLAEMTRIGLPVPAGFTITTECCDYFYKHDKKYPPSLAKEVKQHLARLERATGKKLGDAKDPLLVSVRSGSARSMPGMMETILNLGLNNVSVEALARNTKNDRFAWDAYRRFVQMYCSVVIGLPKEELEHKLREMKARHKVTEDTQVSAAGWRELVADYKKYFRSKTGEDFPDDPEKQLWGAIGAVFGSWMAEKAVTYRRVEQITGLLGTAVNVVQMVFGNTGENSGTGVCFTRDPSTGEKLFYGDFLINAQGEDVVAGIRTPMHLDEMAKLMPKVYKQLEKVRTHSRGALSRHAGHGIHRRRRHALHVADARRQAHPGSHIPHGRGHGEREAHLARKRRSNVSRRKISSGLFYPVIDSILRAVRIGQAKACGRNQRRSRRGRGQGGIHSAKKPKNGPRRGEKVILVRRETSPEDVGGMFVAEGILTATGGKTSHAAVVARGWGKCCVVGAEKLDIDYDKKVMSTNGLVVKQGDWITLDGSDGAVYTGTS